MDNPPIENSVLIPRIEPVNTPLDTGAIPVKPRLRLERKKVLIWGGVVFTFLFLVIGIPALLIFQKAMVVRKSVGRFVESTKSQDLEQIKTNLNLTRKDLNKFKSTYTLLSWSRAIPFFGSYVSDLGHVTNAFQAGLDAGDIILATIEPYSDLLGFRGEGFQGVAAEDGAKTAQDRIDFIVSSLPELLPKMDEISQKMKMMATEISAINPDRYPEKVRGKVIRANIKSAKWLADQMATLLVDGKPVIERAPYLLGMDSPRTYMVLFQNDKELRPTGGFMTAYSIMKVDKAQFSPVLSSDIYSLDAQYKPSITAPDPFIQYIKGPYVLSDKLRLRDMNWSPDFAVSMQAFVPMIKEAGVDGIDGIIAVDTQLLVNILDVIGPIGVPGFGDFSTKIIPECNCAQVIYELESFADVEGPIIWDPLTGVILQKPKNSDNRKKIIGPLMNSVLSNAMGQPKDKLAPLFESIYRSLLEKHVLFYMMDGDKQKAMSDFGLGGTLIDYDGDYLHINDANLGGRKSNLYATEEVEQDIVIENGIVTKTVTITYKNPEKQDGWLNSILPTWVRVYVPKGSQLITSEGLEAKAEPYEDLGKTVFAGYFQLRPEGMAKVTFKYTLPFQVSKEYKLFIQKQPGTDGFLYTLKFGKKMDEFYLKMDKEIKMAI